VRPVVTVGLRPGALDAAERLGRPVIAVVEAPPGRKTAARLAGCVEASFDTADWGEVAEAMRPHAPAAVVGLTERSVVPAAHLRHGLGLPGHSVEVAVRCSDKRAMKRAVRAAGLPCADVVEAEEGLSRPELIARLGLPMVLKAAVGSGGRGTRIAHDAADVPERLADGWMAEAFVDGVEMSVETFVADGRPVFVNATQYLEPAWASLVPAPLAEADLDAVRAHAEAARVALGVTNGMTHLEVFLTPDGPVFGELAVRPPGGHLMRLIARAYGVDPWDTVLRVALGEPVDLPTEAERVAAVQILHPGAGTVLAADGLDTARGMPGVEAVSLRVRRGDTVGPRVGTGQEIGHVLVTGATADEATARLAAAAAAIRVEVREEREAG
jgi:biotin carboxylase